jgi:ComF family protein
MLNVKNTMLDQLLAVVAPHLCLGCGQIGSTFCDNCKYDIISEPLSGCVLCNNISTIGICDDHKVAFNQAWVVGVRSGALQRLIGGFKFRNMKESAWELAVLLHQRLPPLPAGTIIVPVPTSSAHIRERGYDHMVLIAKQLAHLRRLRYRPLLRRTGQSTQHSVGRKQRFIQVVSAFRVDGLLDSSPTYLLIDDIVTTGATISQAALQLRMAGATTIWVAACARQPLD